MELIARTGKTSESHAFKAMVTLEMGEAHLDALALVARPEEALCPHQPARRVAGFLMNVARNLSRDMLGQHFILSIQTSQSAFEAR